MTKRFMRLTPVPNIIKLFTAVIKDDCNKLKCLLDQLEKLAKDKCFSLLQKFVNYGQKSFISLGRGKKFLGSIQ
jgi:hypothetical protein